jgi:GDP-L-fucose synthase
VASVAGSRILVTGGAGFLGRQVVRALELRGADEIFVPRSRDYDLREAAAIRSCLKDSRPEAVIHLAAVVGGIGANQANPATFFYDNAIMGIQLLEQARLAGVRKFLVAGTVCSYPKFTPVPFREDHIWDGYPEETNAPYGMAKKILLVQAQAYRQQYGFNAIYVIPVNLYGPGDNFDPETSHVIPALIKKCIDAREAGLPFIEAWGSGNASREFIYVDDAAEGIVAAMERYDDPEPMNIGCGAEISIRELVDTIRDVTRYQGDVRWNLSKPDGQPRRMLDTSRARDYLGFRPSTGLREGLRRTVEWYEDSIGGLPLPATAASVG